MKRLIVCVIVLASIPAIAQQTPSIEQAMASWNIEAGQLRMALGQAQTEILRLRKQIETECKRE